VLGTASKASTRAKKNKAQQSAPSAKQRFYFIEDPEIFFRQDRELKNKAQQSAAKNLKKFMIETTQESTKGVF